LKPFSGFGLKELYIIKYKIIYIIINMYLTTTIFIYYIFKRVKNIIKYTIIYRVFQEERT
jgi:hypothetical protein